MNKGQRFLMWSLLLAGGIFGCSHQPATGPTDQTVAEKPQSKEADADATSTKFEPNEAPASPPTVEPKAKDVPKGIGTLIDGRESESFTLNPFGTGTVHGNVHSYFVKHRPAADDDPFFVVWTDARGYSGASGITWSANDPPLYSGDLTLKFGDKEDREIKCSFRINDLDQKGQIKHDGKGQLQVDGKTYDFAKGALMLIAGKDGDVRVKLLSRSKLPSGHNAVIAFGKADPDINAFFPDLKTLLYFSEPGKSK